MKCPHCSIHFHDNWLQQFFNRGSHFLTEDFCSARGAWSYRSALCPNCQNWTIEVAVTSNGEPLEPWTQIWPIGANRGPVPTEVPGPIAQDYIEACNVLPISAKASAALSRRCLQSMLRAAGYKA